MDSLAVGEDVAVERERGFGFGGEEIQFVCDGEETAAACPELQQQVVHGIVAVRISRKGGAVKFLRRLVEEAGKLVELLPGCWWSEFALALLTEAFAMGGIFEEVATVDEAFRAVVIWNAEDAVIDRLETQK